MPVVYLGLGSNLGDRAEMIAEACLWLQAVGAKLLAMSQLYETEPWGITDQPRFINAACAVESTLAPHALLAAAKQIERSMGRVQTVRYGPRVVDIDILMYDQVEIVSESLIIPHLGMLNRATVLVPLAEIAPNLRHVRTGLRIEEHLQALGPISGIAPFPPGLVSMDGLPADLTPGRSATAVRDSRPVWAGDTH